jgi:hypothetical protein
LKKWKSGKIEKKLKSEQVKKAKNVKKGLNWCPKIWGWKLFADHQAGFGQWEDGWGETWMKTSIT